MGAKAISRLESYEPLVNCDSGSGCSPKCSDFVIDELNPAPGGYYTPEKRGEFLYEIFSTLKNAVVEVKPNPSYDKVNFSILSDIEGQCHLKIIDSHGNLINKISFDKDNNRYLFSLDISKFNNGMYYYIIKINNEVNLNGKMLIIK